MCEKRLFNTAKLQKYLVSVTYISSLYLLLLSASLNILSPGCKQGPGRSVLTHTCVQSPVEDKVTETTEATGV